jgi:hypothetical protein
MYVILFITHHRYHSLTHLKTPAIEISRHQNHKKMKPEEKSIQYNKTNNT